jgi:hypothetical protein
MYPAQAASFLSHPLLKLSGEDLAQLAELSHYSSRAMQDLCEATGDGSRGGLVLVHRGRSPRVDGGRMCRLDGTPDAAWPMSDYIA